MGKHLQDRKVSRNCKKCNVAKFGKCNLLFFLRLEYGDRGWEEIISFSTRFNYCKNNSKLLHREMFHGFKYFQQRNGHLL